MDKYTVTYNGKPAIKLNERLIIRQGISDEGVELLKNKHRERMFIEEVMNAVITIQKETKEEYNVEYEDVMVALYKRWEDNQFQLQSLWGFPQDANFHNGYALTGCSCSNKMDNMDSLGSSCRWHNVGDVCPFHHPKYQSPQEGASQ